MSKGNTTRKFLENSQKVAVRGSEHRFKPRAYFNAVFFHPYVLYLQLLLLVAGTGLLHNFPFFVAFLDGEEECVYRKEQCSPVCELR